MRAAAVEHDSLTDWYSSVLACIRDRRKNRGKVHREAEGVIGEGDFVERDRAGAGVIRHDINRMVGDGGAGPGHA